MWLPPDASAGKVDCGFRESRCRHTGIRSSHRIRISGPMIQAFHDAAADVGGHRRRPKRPTTPLPLLHPHPAGLYRHPAPLLETISQTGSRPTSPGGKTRGVCNGEPDVVLARAGAEAAKVALLVPLLAGATSRLTCSGRQRRGALSPLVHKLGGPVNGPWRCSATRDKTARSVEHVMAISD